MGGLFCTARAQRIDWQHVVKYRQSDGLSSYNIRRILQDKLGYLWVGTQFGLSRFDGTQFLNYAKTAPAKFQLCGVDVRELIEDTAKSSLWVYPGEFGFNRIDMKSMQVNYTGAIPYDGLEEFGISMVHLQEHLWFGAIGLRVFNTARGVFEQSPYRPDPVASKRDLKVRSLWVDRYQNVWCFYAGYGLVIYQGSTKKVLRYIPLRAFNDHLQTGQISVNSCIADGDNGVLVATSQGLRRMKFSADYQVQIDNSPCRSLQALNTESLQAICRTPSGQLLIAGHNELYRFDAALSSYSILQEAEPGPDGDWLSAVQYIYADREDNLWLGCQQGLAFIAGAKSPFQPYYFNKITHEKLDHVRSLCVLKNGDILAGLRNGIAYVRRENKEFSIVDKEHLFHHIFEDKAGNIIVGRNDGIKIYDRSGLTPVNRLFPELAAFADCPVNSHLFIGDSLIVMGTENDSGLLLWNTKQHRVRKLGTASTPMLASNVVNNIYRDSKGRIWVLSDHSLFILSSDLKNVQQVLLSRKGKDSRRLNLFFDMCDADGYYWIAAYGSGIVKIDTAFRVQQIFNTQSGLADDGVYQIFASGGNLIVTSDNGLSILRPDGSARKYFMEDGLHSNSFEEVAGVQQEGLIYAGGVKGFTVIDPRRFSSNKMPPRVYICRVEIECSGPLRHIDTTNLSLRELDIPNDALQTTVSFSGINFSNPRQTTFAYRLRKDNTGWINIGTQHYINLIGLPPGEYLLEVKAANEDGVWSSPVSLTLDFLPKWYQTWWFKAMLALLAAGIVFLIYKIRINQLLRQQRIRKDVASDLHDDIGSSLNSVKIFAHLAMADPQEKTYIQRMEESLEHATAGLRDMIWILDDNRDTIDELCKRIQQFAARPAESLGIKVSFVCPEIISGRKLTKRVKRNLYLIAKEAINNSVKYAGCSHVLLTFSSAYKKLIFDVEDNGNGFDVLNTETGYGLANIRNRAQQISYHCDIASDENGTRIRLTEK